MKDESLLEEIGENLLEDTNAMANVTVRADADRFLLCDGLQIERANNIAIILSFAKF